MQDEHHKYLQSVIRQGRAACQSLKCDDSLREDILRALSAEELSLDERAQLATTILRKLGRAVPTYRFVRGSDIDKPEHDEWLVLTYQQASFAPKPRVRNARTKDVRKGRYAPYVPQANRRS